MALVRIAWRNLWRSPRRTSLTVAASVFAIVLTLWTLALAAGSHERWIDTIVRLYPGHVEVSALDYRENLTLDYGMRLDPSQAAGLDHLGRATGWAPRLESWALAIPDVEGSLGRAAWVAGVDPKRERGLSRLPAMVDAGEFFDSGSDYQVVLGHTLADNLGAKVGDSIILLTSDYYGSQAADRFRVVGTLRVGNPDLDGYAAVVRLSDLQEFLEFEDGISYVALFTQDSRNTAPLETELAALFRPGDYEITAWPDLIPDMVQFILLDDVGAWISIGILIVIVGFGILNTVLMSVFERVREFGVLRALGMRPRAIFQLVMIESAFLSLVGIAIGLALGVPLTLWFQHHPIPVGDGSFSAVFEVFKIEPVIVFSLRRAQIVGTPLAIFVVAVLAALPPAIRASRGRPVDALRET